jgi:hypothetical protein
MEDDINTATAPEQQAQEPEPTQSEQSAAPEQASEPESLADSITQRLKEMEGADPAKEPEAEPDYLTNSEADQTNQATGEQASEGAEGTKAAAGTAGKAEPEKAQEPKSPEQEEEQILAMAQNERSKERLKQVFQERREGQQAKQSLGTLVKAFADAGYDQDSVRTILDIGRKVSSNDKGQVRQAIQMLDRIRSNLCQQIGESPELYDPISDYPDLKKRVDEMGMDRAQAMELINARRIQAEQAARQQATLQAQQEQAMKAQRVALAKQAVGAFFNSKRNEIDFAAKMKAIQAHLTPERVSQFVSTVPPEMWAAQLELMYNTIGAGSVRPASAPRPISARQASIGHPANAKGATLQDDIVAKMNAMGI